MQVVSAKMQQITLREFLPMLGITEDAVRTATPMTNSAAISIEFAMSGYRFGHDLVPDKMGSLNTVNLFNGEKFFGIDETGAIPKRFLFRLKKIWVSILHLEAYSLRTL